MIHRTRSSREQALVLPRQHVLAQAPQCGAEIRNDLLTPHHEDQLPRAERVRAQLAGRRRRSDENPVLSHRQDDELYGRQMRTS